MFVYRIDKIVYVGGGVVMGWRCNPYHNNIIIIQNVNNIL